MKLPNIQRRLKQSAPVPSAAAGVYFGALLLTRDLTHAAECVCHEADLSLPQYNALRILRGAGKEGLSCGEVGARMLHRVPDVTRLLDRLQERGLVRRARQEDDRRVVRVWITPAGKRLIAPLDTALGAALEAALSGVDAGAQQALATALDSALGDGEPGGE